jgi:hypothetical protein
VPYAIHQKLDSVEPAIDIAIEQDELVVAPQREFVASGRRPRFQARCASHRRCASRFARHLLKQLFLCKTVIFITM